MGLFTKPSGSLLARIGRSTRPALLALLFGASAALGSGFPESVDFFNHVHSDASDDNPSLGFLKLSADEILREAERHLAAQARRGAIAITDHNQRTLPRAASERVQPIPGAEWGLRTHLGLLGLYTPWAPLSEPERHSFEEQVGLARETGSVRVINHPLYRGREWERERWGEAEAVEVVNGLADHVSLGILRKAFRSSHNREAIALWDQALREGRRITALGGSDFHFHIPRTNRSKFLFYPANTVFAASNEPERVLEAIRQGRVSIQALPDAPRVFVRARRLTSAGPTEWAEMGSALGGAGTGPIEFELRVEQSKARTDEGDADSCAASQGLLPAEPGRRRRSKHRLWVELYVSGGLGAWVRELEADLDPRCQEALWRGVFEGSETLQGSVRAGFIRAEVRPTARDRAPLSLSNPVYLEL